MKTLIIAFWVKDPKTGAETDTFLLSRAMTNLIKEEQTYNARFKEKHFIRKDAKDVPSRVEFIREFIFSQFLVTKCQIMVIVINETLKKSFLKRIGYYKAIRKKSRPAPAIPGEVFGDDDKVFVYLQDKASLGFFPNECLTSRTSKADHITLRVFSKFKFN